MATTKTSAAAKEATTVTAHKGFDKSLQCRGFQYEVGKTYTHDGDVEACEGGFHACENPLDVWSYYGPATSRFAKVTLSGALSLKPDGDSKLAAGSITIDAEIGLPQVIADAVAWIAKLAKGNTATGDSGHAAATGYYGHAAATGYSGHAAATGNSGIAAALGINGKAKASASGAIVLARFNADRSIRHIRASKVGENGIKADTFYTLSVDGQFVEAEA